MPEQAVPNLKIAEGNGFKGIGTNHLQYAQQVQ